MTTYKQLLSRSIGMHVLTTALFFAVLLIGLFIVTERATGDTYYYGMIVILPALPVAIGGITILLALFAMVLGKSGPAIGLTITMLGHLMSGFVGARVAFGSFSDVKDDPYWLIV